MKAKFILIPLVFLTLLVFPNTLLAQGEPGALNSLHGILERLYDEMIPLSSRLINVARALAGFAALWYIAYRVWGHIARAEPIDMYPLLRPFALGLAILLFPTLLAILNGIMQPIVNATANMVEGSNQAISRHFDEQFKALYENSGFQNPGNGEDWQVYAEQGDNDSLVKKFLSWWMMDQINTVFSAILQLLYAAATLCINTLRTFNLIVLAILGPLVLGLSVFDGFQHTLTAWLSRYINVSLWLPVANIFGAILAKIQANMMIGDQNILSGTAYIVFMIIAIVGYFTVPSVANYIIQPGGRDNLLNKTNNVVQTTAKAAAAII